MRILYLHGFTSSPGSRKARYFGARLRECGFEPEIPELDDGDFEHLTISGQLRLIERIARGEAVTLIGSSMGGYLAALYAARHPETARLVLLAPAFSLARRWPDWLGADQMAEWRRTGRHMIYHYADGCERPLGYDIIEDAAQYDDFPAVSQPTLVFHGRNDTTVPCSLSEEFAKGRPNATLTLLDDGHELSGSMEETWRGAKGFLT